MSPAVPRGWRVYGVVAGLFATVVVVLGTAQPWFERDDPPFGSLTYTPWPWGTADAEVPDSPFVSTQIAELVMSREWGLTLFIAAAVGALISFIVAAKRPGEARMGRATIANVVAAVIALILTGLMWYAFATGGGPQSSTALRLGFLLGVPAQLGWLASAIAVARLQAGAVPAPARLPTAASPWPGV